MSEFLGTWRIVEMEQWDSSFVDMEVPGFFLFSTDKTGDFQFGLVRGHMAFHYATLDGKKRIEFSWMGSDEMDPVSGFGWAEIMDSELVGRIYFHDSDDSLFRATKQE